MRNLHGNTILTRRKVGPGIYVCHSVVLISAKYIIKVLWGYIFISCCCTATGSQDKPNHGHHKFFSAMSAHTTNIKSLKGLSIF